MAESPATPPVSEPPWQRHSLRIPREDAAVFARPPVSDGAAMLQRNRDRLRQADVRLQGRTLRQLREWSRQQVARAARAYTAEVTGADGPEPNVDGLVVGGHQPTLFHPGVWAKNFALARIARDVGGTALNLVIDNDLLATTRLRVPVGDRENPRVEMVAWDEDRPAEPWEEAAVLNRELFASFGKRIAPMMARWNVVPLAGEIWPPAVEQLRRSPLARDAMTAARARQERRWGIANLELPLSRLCELDPFLWFASHLLVQLPRFREIHNRVLHEYRRVNRIRSRTHPVADLQETGGWQEAPFWVWRAGERRRARLFARQVGRELHLFDGRETISRLRLAPEMDACCAVEDLRELAGRGVRLRTRALTTTLFARLCLADLFVHGIGGAKYDEMTDRIIGRFFGIPAPEFATVSATLHLPIAEPFDATAADEARLERRLRELAWNPERHLSRANDAAIEALRKRKEQLIAARQQAKAAAGLSRSERRRRRAANRERYRELQDVTQQLAQYAAPLREETARELESVRRRLAANGVLQDREFSFCLYPAQKLRPFLTSL
jgi:hypothetical protein